MSKKNGPEPYYRPKKKRWYVQIGGKQINLGPDEAQAKVRWHQLMAGGLLPAPQSEDNSDGPLACVVIDLFLAWCLKHRSKRTSEWYRGHLQSFLDSLPDAATIAAGQVKPFHVVNWADAHATWGPMQRRGAITAVQRAFNWAEKLGHLDRSPLRGIEKPPPKRREQVLTPAEFAGLLARIKEPRFRDVLEFCWETGARVQEVRVVEARHVRLDGGRVELPPAEAKGKKRWRFIYLSPRAEEIATKLVAAYPSGVLFRNAAGNRWDAQNFNNRFIRLQTRMGREEMKRRGFTLSPEKVREVVASLKPERREGGQVVPKSEKDLLREARKKLMAREAAKLGTKYALTTIRHSFATRLLESGVDHITVAALLGHADATMLARVYQHVGEKTDFLRAELLRASPGRASNEAGAA
jgi:integrase